MRKLIKKVAIQQTRVDVYRKYFEESRNVISKTNLSPESPAFVPSFRNPFKNVTFRKPLNHVNHFSVENDTSRSSINCDHVNHFSVENDTPRSTFKESDMLYKLLLTQNTPDIEIQSFNGNPLDFHFFISCFESAVEQNIRRRDC